MPLHQRIGRIFCASGDTNAYRDFSNSLKRFLVKDIGTNRDELRVILLVESPHTHEVGYRYPLAGETGRHVRDIINGCSGGPITGELPDGPIGRFVHDGHLGSPNHDSNHSILRLGVMNVSRLPLQGKAYSCVPWGDGDCRGHDRWHDYIRCMEYIKKEPQVQKYRGFGDTRQLWDEINQLQCAIAKDLRKRLDCLSVKNRTVLLVHCGPVAKEFYTKAIGGRPICAINTCDLPHPARKGWKNLDCQNKCLRNILNHICPPNLGRSTGSAAVGHSDR